MVVTQRCSVATRQQGSGTFASLSVAFHASRFRNPRCVHHLRSHYCQLDKGDKTPAKESSSFGTARDVFVSKTKMGESPATVSAVSTVHDGAITLLHPLAGTEAAITSVTTAGIDGTLGFWDLAELGVDLAAVGLA